MARLTATSSIRNELDTSLWEACPLFRLHLTTSRGTVVVHPGDFASDARDDAGPETTWLYSECTLDGCSGLEAVVRIARMEQELVGTIEVRSGEVRVDRVQFPYVEWNRCDSGESLMVPGGWAGELRNPRECIRRWCEKAKTPFDFLHYTPVEDGEIVLYYPSVLNMQYVMLHTPGRVLYLGSYSTDERTLSYRLGTTRDGLRLSVNHHPYLSGATWRSPECAVALLPGDWHVAADVYASHMRDAFGPAPSPRWIQDDFHGWVQLIMKSEGKPADYTLDDLPGLARTAAELGLSVLTVAGWSGNGHDTLYPDYRPCRELGTPQEFAAALDKVRQAGLRPSMYTNGRIVDPLSEYHRSTGGASSCLSEDGVPNTERYGTSVDFEVACPHDPAYRAQMAGEIRRMLTDYGAGAVQIDQVSSGDAVMCFNTDHGHDSPSSNYLPGYRMLLQDVQRAGHEVDPDFFVWVEGCHEYLAQFYDVGQSGDEGDGCGPDSPRAEQFPYVYPHRVMTGPCGSVNTLCRTWGQGKAVDLPAGSLSNSLVVKLVRDYVALRRALPEYFVHGTFRDNVGLDVAGDARGYRIGRDDDRGDLVNLWLHGAGEDQLCSAYVRLTRDAADVTGRYPAGIEIDRQGEWLHVGWTGPIATLTIEDN